MNLARLALPVAAALLGAGCAAFDPHGVITRQLAPDGAAAHAPVPPPAGAGLGESGRRAALDFVWSTVNERYYDPKLNGVDWAAVRGRWAPRARAGEPDEAFWDLLDRMTGELRDAYTRGHVRADCAKLFLDGVAPSLTASFLDPYIPGAAPGYDAASYSADALLQLAPDRIAEEVVALDRLGFKVKMHAVGDRAVRAGLDAIEPARRINGASGLRHEIAHTPFVHADDLGRFKALDAIAEVSPKLWFPNPITAGQVAVLGAERTQRCHPIRSLMSAGAELVYGSDWPAAAPDVDPWIGLAGMLTRRHPKGAYHGAVGLDEAITLEEALPLLTVNGARAMGRDELTGALAPGRSADFIVLDRALDAVEPAAIADTRVLTTVFEGEVVHETDMRG